MVKSAHFSPNFYIVQYINPLFKSFVRHFVKGKNCAEIGLSYLALRIIVDDLKFDNLTIYHHAVIVI